MMKLNLIETQTVDYVGIYPIIIIFLVPYQGMVTTQQIWSICIILDNLLTHFFLFYSRFFR